MKTVFPLIFIFTVLTTLPSHAQEAVDIKTQNVAGSVYMLEGAGGNIGVLIGKDGTLIVDNQFHYQEANIRAAIEKLGGDTPKLIINTHYHGDHTGANADFGSAGTIIAHENVRIRLLNEEDMPREGYPVITFEDRIRIHFNDEEIDIIHLPNGHTDGDSIVWFKNSNVVHMGDHLFYERFPYIDIPGGGSVDGLVNNLEAVIKMVAADTKIIPGHGVLTNVLGISESADMIRATSEAVRADLDAGKGPGEITIDDRWGSYNWQFINSDRWVQILEADHNRQDSAPRR